jgi:uncharacterized membrane protein YgcG
MIYRNKFIALQHLAAAAAVAIALATATGCQQQEKKVAGDDFPPEGPNAVTHLLDTQAASGARSDATLYACHFDGANLNSLGMAKLDLMLKDDDAANPMTVYLASTGASSDTADARRGAITRYLKDRGLTGDEIKFVDGTNPGIDASGRATDNLKNLSKSDTGASSGGSSTGDSSNASGSSSDASGGSAGGGGMTSH